MVATQTSGEPSSKRIPKSSIVELLKLLGEFKRKKVNLNFEVFEGEQIEVADDLFAMEELRTQEEFSSLQTVRQAAGNSR